jgi:hypothetical protein
MIYLNKSTPNCPSCTRTMFEDFGNRLPSTMLFLSPIIPRTTTLQSHRCARFLRFFLHIVNMTMAVNCDKTKRFQTDGIGSLSVKNNSRLKCCLASPFLPFLYCFAVWTMQVKSHYFSFNVMIFSYSPNTKSRFDLRKVVQLTSYGISCYRYFGR